MIATFWPETTTRCVVLVARRSAATCGGSAPRSPTRMPAASADAGSGSARSMFATACRRTARNVIRHAGQPLPRTSIRCGKAAVATMPCERRYPG